MNFNLSTGDILDLYKYAAVLAVGFVVAYLLTPILIKLGPRLGLIDTPDERRIHLTPTPRSGGIAVFFGFHLACAGAFFLFWPGNFPGSLNQNWWLCFLLASSLLLVVGIWDDARNLSPFIKLGGQVAAAALLFILTGNGLGSILGFGLPYWLDFVLTIFWCVAIINAFNLIDGMDGLCAGLAVISGTGLVIAFALGRNFADGLILLGLIGAALGFLRFNFHPARIFLGDAGSMFLGFTLSVMALQSNVKSTLIVSMGIPLLAAGVPVMDTALAIWRRSMRRALSKSEGSGKGPKIMGADKDHLHHRLLDLGLTQRQVALALYLTNAFLVSLGLFSILFRTELVGLFLLIFAGGVYVAVRHLVHVEIWDTGRFIIQGLKRPKKHTFRMFLYPVWDVAVLTGSFCFARFIVHPQRMDLLANLHWLQEIPLWVAPVFIALVVSKTYLKVWTYAGFRDHFEALLAVGIGSSMAMGVVSLLEVDFQFRVLATGLVFTLLSLFGILGPRAFVMLLREWMLTAANQERKRSRYVTRHILLYGAGDRGGLFMRDRRLVHPEEMAKTQIVGFIDDSPGLRRRWIHGLEVFGGGRELEGILEKYDVDEIVLTCHLNPKAFHHCVDICKRKQVILRDWNRYSTEIDLNQPREPKSEAPFSEQPR